MKPVDIKLKVKKAFRFLAMKGIIATLVAAPCVGIVKVADIYLLKLKPDLQKLNQEEVQLNHFDFYPYTGFHLQSDFHQTGDNDLCGGHGPVDIRSGDHGFFIDFDLDAPPPKASNEFRIVLTGGSAAQGFGAHSNSEMFYALLQKRLAEHYNQSGIKLTLINLAMGGSITYQNYIDLNRWGHQLGPDLIVSFSGRNDLVVPLYHSRGTDLPNGGIELMRIFEASQPYNNPRWVKALGHFLPGFVAQFGISIRVQNMDDRAIDRYRSRYPKNHNLLNTYVDALRSIKRDFIGIPIALVSQPINQRDHSAIANLDYNGFMQSVFDVLNGYFNKNWYYLPMNKNWNIQATAADNFKTELLVDECHLSAKGQRRAADELFSFLVPIVDMTLAERK